MGHSEVSMKEGDTVELLKIGCAGWWYIKVLSKLLKKPIFSVFGASTNSWSNFLGNNGGEGWAPAAFLDPIHRRTHRSGSKHID